MTIADLPLASSSWIPIGFSSAATAAGERLGPVHALPQPRYPSRRSFRLAAACSPANSPRRSRRPAAVRADGFLEFSLRPFPRIRSTHSRAFFLHRVVPSASWTDEVSTDPANTTGLGRSSGLPARVSSSGEPPSKSFPAGTRSSSFTERTSISAAGSGPRHEVCSSPGPGAARRRGLRSPKRPTADARREQHPLREEAPQRSLSRRRAVGVASES